MSKSKFRKIDPYDCFCGPGSHIAIQVKPFNKQVKNKYTEYWPYPQPQLNTALVVIHQKKYIFHSRVCEHDPGFGHVLNGELGFSSFPCYPADGSG